jgi:hypothetical protein
MTAAQESVDGRCWGAGRLSLRMSHLPLLCASSRDRPGCVFVCSTTTAHREGVSCQLLTSLLAAVGRCACASYRYHLLFSFSCHRQTITTCVLVTACFLQTLSPAALDTLKQ